MLPVDPDLNEAVTRAAGSAVTRVDRVGGGDTSTTAVAGLADGRRVFVKAHRDAPAGFFTAEARGLRWLGEAGTLRVPEVIGIAHPGPVAVLVLELITPGAAADDHDEILGRGLAGLHRAGAATFGGEQDGFIGPLPQDNTPETDWVTFWSERRIRPWVRRAVDTGRLPGEAIARAERHLTYLADRAGPPEPPARLHGDLWGGNALVDERGSPVLIDPAAYGGHREVDLAMMRLFGGFGPRVFASYQEAFPLADGHGERVRLWQLYPLLVHTVLFGGSYAASVMEGLERDTRSGR